MYVISTELTQGPPLLTTESEARMRLPVLRVKQQHPFGCHNILEVLMGENYTNNVKNNVFF